METFVRNSSIKRLTEVPYYYFLLLLIAKLTFCKVFNDEKEKSSMRSSHTLLQLGVEHLTVFGSVKYISVKELYSFYIRYNVKS